MPVLPDILKPDLDVVFCGTAAGDRSAAVGAYYAGPGNRFWRTLHEIGLTERQLQPAEYRRLLEYGIGLTDIAKEAVGTDDNVPRSAFDVAGLQARILKYRPRILAFNGLNAARGFLGRHVAAGLQPEHIGSTAIFVLPSTSGAARRYWKVAAWHDLAASVRAESTRRV